MKLCDGQVGHHDVTVSALIPCPQIVNYSVARRPPIGDDKAWTTWASHMRITASVFLLALFALFSADAFAEADRDSLVVAWEAHIEGLPGTESFEKTADGVYRYVDTDLPYDGELKLLGALVRPAESAGIETDFSHFGMVEFELTDMPVERLSSQVYYYWLADRQTLHYSKSAQEWVDASAYQESITDLYGGSPSFGALSFMLNYGIWILLIGLLIFIFVGFNRQTRKARSLMDETADINDKARQNLDRAEAMQDEVLSIARETRDLQKESNELLVKMLQALQR